METTDRQQWGDDNRPRYIETLPLDDQSVLHLQALKIIGEQVKMAKMENKIRRLGP